MRILTVAPLWFPVAADAPGGIESCLPGLIDALTEEGCDVTLVASGDSNTAATLVAPLSTNVWARVAAGRSWEYAPYEQHQLRIVYEMAADFDLIHSHLGPGGYLLSSMTASVPVLHTHHNEISPDVEWFVRRNPTLWFSAVSDYQARLLRGAGASNCAVISNGLDVERFAFSGALGNGLTFLGRIEEEKGPDLAIQTARELGMRLSIAGPIVDDDFFTESIEPQLDDRIRYIGMVDHRLRNELLGRTSCVLMPSRCAEGFGMVAVEAMACGTPVVGLANGALPEIIDEGVTGYVTNDPLELPGLTQQARSLDRRAIRERVAERFNLRDVARDYVSLYRTILTAAVAPDFAAPSDGVQA